MNGATRVFCTKLSGLFPRALLDAIMEVEPKFQLLDSDIEMDFESPIWDKMRIICTNSRTPIEIEHHISGVHGSAVQEETIRFMAMLEILEETWGKREVAVYLRLTREMFVLRCEGEADGQTEEMIRKCAKILAGFGEGVVQVDGVGFFKNGELALPLDQDRE